MVNVNRIYIRKIEIKTGCQEVIKIKLHKQLGQNSEIKKQKVTKCEQNKLIKITKLNSSQACIE